MRKQININKEELLKMAKQGISYKKIAKYFLSSEATIRQRLKSLGFEKQKTPSGRLCKVSKRLKRLLCQ